MGTQKPSDKGVSGNSGNASNGRFTLTGIGGRPPETRREWKAPRTGDLQSRAAKRPK